MAGEAACAPTHAVSAANNPSTTFCLVSPQSFSSSGTTSAVYCCVSSPIASAVPRMHCNTRARRFRLVSVRRSFSTVSSSPTARVFATRFLRSIRSVTASTASCRVFQLSLPSAARSFFSSGCS